MENKILVKLIVPEIGENFDIFIPVNELVWKTTKLMLKSVSDLTGVTLDIKNNWILINQSTGKIYDNNEIVVNTDIRNTTELILVSRL